MAVLSRYLLPGFMFQSVVIGGGYATGRELMEFFLPAGPLGGLLGLLVSGLVFGLVLAMGFEFARVTGAYDYRSFCRELLGRGWVVFEVAFFILLLLILAVIAAASGEMVSVNFGMSPIVGTVGLMVLIALLTFYGSEAIKKVLAAWSFLLYAVYAALFVFAFVQMGDQIEGAYHTEAVEGGWLSGGVLYSGYNLAVLPAILFAIRGQRSRGEAMGSGLMAGAIAVVPAMLFYTALMALYPEIGHAPVPAAVLMQSLNVPVLSIIFQIVIFGTFVETGTALLHSVNERIEGNFEEAGKAMPRKLRPSVAISFLIIAIAGGTWLGVIELIASGYSLLTLVFIGVLVVPLMTFGAWRVWGPQR